MSEVQDQNLNSDHLDLKHLDKKTEELLVKKSRRSQRIFLFSIFRLPGRSGTPYKEWQDLYRL